MFVYKKAEKHAAVSYMLTNFLSDNEPLKWKLRGNSISFMSLINGLRSGNNNGTQRLLEVISKIDELKSLYQIMRLGGHISEMNLSLVTKELTALKNLLNEKVNQKIPVQEIAIDQSIFDEELSERATELSREGVNIKDESDYRGHKVSQKVGANAGEKYGARSDVVKSNPQSLKTKTKIIKKTKPQPAYSAGKKTHKEARRESIKSILQNRGELTIKDISMSINGCSEKTIQRELNALIKDNSVKRTGERRWSKYSLV